MQVITYAEAKKNLKSLFDQVVDDADSVLITRNRGGDVVVMSKTDYDSLVETGYLLSFQANRQHLEKSIAQYHAKEVTEHDLIK